MKRALFLPSLVILIVGTFVSLPRLAPRLAILSGQTASGMPSTKNGEWPMYTADLRGSKYSPLDQIDASNFNTLEVAWRFKTDNLGPRPENKLEGTPIMIGGMLYTTGGSRRSIVALDGRTGELKWVWNMDEGLRAAVAPRQLSGRGLSYWTDGKGDDRVVAVTIGYRLVELNAKTGQPVKTFGKDGILDLKEGVIIGKGQQIDFDRGEIGLHSTPAVVGDVIIVGSSMAEGLGYRYSTNAKGLVRAFDARTGKQIWRFNTIPTPGEFGNDTWEKESWSWTGNNGVWTQITVDPEAGLVYLPVESPTIDTYGGNRPGNNLFGETLVAVDLKTGVRKWHFQLVHHPIWDHDISSAPLLIDAVIDGRPRKLVAQPTKQAYLYVFDRITGQPIWPMPETPVPQTDVPGEKTSPTQPIPSKPPSYSRAFLAESDVIDFTPALHAQALENLKKYRWEPTPFIPGTMQNGKWQGAINVGNTVGGINWPGASFDPETATFYGQANNSSVTTTNISEAYLSIVNPEAQAKNRIPIWEAEPPPSGERGRGAGRGGPGGRGAGRGLPAGAAGAPGGAAAAGAPGGEPPAAPPAGFGGGGGRGGLTQGLEGLPIAKPPYGVLTAIDLNTGTIKFRVPHGDTPDNVRAALERLGITYPEKTGQSGSVGLMVTKTLVVVGDPQVTTVPGRPGGARGAMLRAYDKQTGKEVGAVYMPAAQSGSPMTYSVNGKQYIVVAVSGGNYTGEYIAYALP
ncbi:MAG: PQQ-binding-like beta-propeller repeat protein [Acidobacteriia bacterium]|nr:PQQ-binding-like beta-propeller repeat protein [Terriglobia bacterium]